MNIKKIKRYLHFDSTAKIIAVKNVISTVIWIADVIIFFCDLLGLNIMHSNHRYDNWIHT